MDGGYAHDEDAPGGEARQQGGQAEPDAGGRRRRGCHGRQLPVIGGDACELGFGGAVDGELRRPLDQVDHRCRQLTPQCGLVGLAPAGQGPGQPRHDGGRGQQGGRQHQPRRGQEGPDQPDRGRPHQDGDGEGWDDPEDQVLQRVHVGDQPGQQVAAAERRESGRGQALEVLVDADPLDGQHAERSVVADQTLAVAEEAPGEAEELDQHDGHGQGGLRRMLRRTGQQPGRRGHQPDGRSDRSRAEEGCQHQAACGGAGDPQGATDGCRRPGLDRRLGGWVRRGHDGTASRSMDTI